MKKLSILIGQTRISYIILKHFHSHSHIIYETHIEPFTLFSPVLFLSCGVLHVISTCWLGIVDGLHIWFYRQSYCRRTSLKNQSDFRLLPGRGWPSHWSSAFCWWNPYNVLTLCWWKRHVVFGGPWLSSLTPAAGQMITSEMETRFRKLLSDERVGRVAGSRAQSCTGCSLPIVAWLQNPAPAWMVDSF